MYLYLSPVKILAHTHCRSTDPNAVVMRFPTSGGRDVVLRKIVYDAYHNNFIDKAKKLEDEYKARAKRRKMSAPNTAFGEDLTVGGQLKSTQEYNEMLDLKREEKVRKAAEREQNRRRKIVTESKHLSEAQDILRQCSKRSDADKNLRKRHLIALLRSVCAPPELLKDTVTKSQMLATGILVEGTLDL